MEVGCKIGGGVCAFIHNITCMVKNLPRQQGQSCSKCGGYDDPLGILKPGKIRKNIHTGFFKPYNFPKGWGQASNKYIQHIYSYSTLSNYPNTQHGQGNEFVNAIGTDQQSLCNRSGNDAISGDYADSWSE